MGGRTIAATGFCLYPPLNLVSLRPLRRIDELPSVAPNRRSMCSVVAPCTQPPGSSGGAFPCGSEPGIRVSGLSGVRIPARRNDQTTIRWLGSHGLSVRRAVIGITNVAPVTAPRMALEWLKRCLGNPIWWRCCGQRCWSCTGGLGLRSGTRASCYPFWAPHHTPPLGVARYPCRPDPRGDRGVVSSHGARLQSRLRH